jgi:hypothetical protein
MRTVTDFLLLLLDLLLLNLFLRLPFLLILLFLHLTLFLLPPSSPRQNVRIAPGWTI